MIDISIIIVTYNSEEDIKGCLDSLLIEESTKNEIIVVDNASKDKTKEILRNYSGRIRVFYSRKNLGYAQANNIGFKNSSGKYIFLLNPDTEVVSGSLRKMFDYMEMNYSVIILGPLVLNPDKTIQPSLRRFPDFRILFFELTGLSRIFPFSKNINSWRIPDFNYKEIKDVEQPMGAALFLRKSFFTPLESQTVCRDDKTKIHPIANSRSKVPSEILTGFTDVLLDKKFSMFFNDVDLCARVKEGGGRILFFPGASVIHKRGKSTGKVKEKMIPLHTKGLLRYFVKHRTSLLDRILLLIFLPSIIINAILRVLLLRFYSKDF
ncbi:glycosyltransferase family 2 protein [candidate division WOR-3 bacterium]|nr:glycosyltransferase family 2 protein [candidate division WOR-3 bacterium]